MKRWKCTVCGQIFTGELPPVPCPVCGAGEDAFVLLSDEGADTLFRRDSSDRHVIVGGGAAALSAAKAIRARDTGCAIAMICGEGVIPYNRPTLSDALADGNSFESMALEPYPYFAENRVQLITYARCASIDAESKLAKLSDGTELPYDKLLLATGANPFNPIPRDDDAIPTFTLRGFADMEAILGVAKGGNKRALVVGGGILGLEAALALHQLGCKVAICELADRILSLQADEEGSARIHSEMEALGIAIHTGKSASRLTAAGAALTDGGELSADFALISIGVRSELTLAKQLGLATNRGIVVDDTMQTSHKAIYAAGDCAEFDGRVAGLWAAAVDQGTTAGAAMAGDPATRYTPIVPATAFEVGALTMFSAGTLSGKQHLTGIDQRTGVYRRLYFDANHLVGAIFLGDTSKSAQIMSLIASRATPSETKAFL